MDMTKYGSPFFLNGSPCSSLSLRFPSRRRESFIPPRSVNGCNRRTSGWCSAGGRGCCAELAR